MNILEFFFTKKIVGLIINYVACSNEAGKHSKMIYHMKLIYLLCMKILISPSYICQRPTINKV